MVISFSFSLRKYNAHTWQTDPNKVQRTHPDKLTFIQRTHPDKLTLMHPSSSKSDLLCFEINTLAIIQFYIISVFVKICFHRHLHLWGHGEGGGPRLLHRAVHLPQRPLELAGLHGHQHGVGSNPNHPILQSTLHYPSYIISYTNPRKCVCI